MLRGGSGGKYLSDIPVTVNDPAGGPRDCLPLMFTGFRCAVWAERKGP